MSREGVLPLGGAGFIGNALPECGTVVHLASATTPGSSASHPDRELPNLALALHLLELMQSQPEWLRQA